MVKEQGSLRRTAKIGAFVAILALALSVPGMAFAANTATFYGATPAPGSSSTVGKPTIVLGVYDKNGVTGSGSYRMWISGKRVYPTINYLNRGKNAFKLTYKVPTDLSIGAHAVTVKIRDRKAKNSTYSWRFTTLAGDRTPPVTESEIGAAGVTLSASDAGGSGVAHTYYRLDNGVQTEGTVVGSSVLGPHMVVFWSVDAAGNVESPQTALFQVGVPIAESHELPDLDCADSGCHGTKLVNGVEMPIGLPDIHDGACFMCHVDDDPAKTTSNCMACHAGHTTHVPITSTSTPSCTSCHVTGTQTAVSIHGECSTCHASTIPAVVAAISTGPATCETCHTGALLPNHDPAVHTTTAANTCLTGGFCHAAGSVVTLHEGVCARCHANPDHAASVVCSDCHGPLLAQHVEASDHTTTNTCASGNATGCHALNVMLIHGTSSPGCAACHAAGATASTDCADCHAPGSPLAPPASHTAQPAHMVATSSCFNPTCHSTDASVIHGGAMKTPRPGCADCHNSTATPSTDCDEVCHTNIGTATDPHEPVYNINTQTAHHVGSPTCTNCHVQATGIRSCSDAAPCHGPAAAIHRSATGTLSSACTSCHGTDIAAAHSDTANCFCHVNTPSWLRAEVAALMDTSAATECVDCHTGDHAAHGFNEAVSGHNTTTYGTVGAFEKFNGLAGNPLVRWESEIASSSLNATWVVESGFQAAVRPLGITSVTVGQVGTMTTDWELPEKQVFWAIDDPSAPVTTLMGLDWDSVVTCQDCHSNLSAAGPHGAADNWALDANYPGDYSMAELTKYVTANLAFSSTIPAEIPSYQVPLSVSGIAVRPGNTTPLVIKNRTDGTQGPTAIICAKCHDLENQVPLIAGAPVVQNTPVFGSNTAHNSHHQDQADGSAQCVSCHIGVPHGWKRPRLLVNTDVDKAPYLDPKATGSTRTNNGVQMYRMVDGEWVAQPAGGTGFNLIGMQSLSAVDNHVAIKDATDPAVFPAAGLDAVGTDDMVYWSEASCQACNDHGGEDGIRILESEE